MKILPCLRPPNVSSSLFLFSSFLYVRPFCLFVLVVFFSSIFVFCSFWYPCLCVCFVLDMCYDEKEGKLSEINEAPFAAQYIFLSLRGALNILPEASDKILIMGKNPSYFSARFRRNNPCVARYYCFVLTCTTGENAAPISERWRNIIGT